MHKSSTLTLFDLTGINIIGNTCITQLFHVNVAATQRRILMGIFSLFSEFLNCIFECMCVLAWEQETTLAELEVEAES